MLETWGCQVEWEDAHFLAMDASRVPPPESCNVRVASPIGSTDNQDTFPPVSSPSTSLEGPHLEHLTPFDSYSIDSLLGLVF